MSKMTSYQRAFLRALVNNEPRTVYYFPRAMGKTYVRNFVKNMGRLVTERIDLQLDSSDTTTKGANAPTEEITNDK